MYNPKVSLFCAVGKNLAMGKNNSLLWQLPGDLPRFKKITSGHVVIMGRKTFESIGKPLSYRINIVVTKSPDFKCEGCEITHSVDQALDLARQKEKEEIFIIGGGEIFKQTIDLADKLYLTIVDQSPKADTFFPDYSDFKKVIYKEQKNTGDIKYKFIELER